MLGLGLVMLNSYANSTSLMADYYGKHARTRAFIRRFQLDGRRLLETEGRPLRIVDAPLPEGAGTKGVRNASYLFVALGIDVIAAPPGPGVYRVAESGSIVPAN